MRESERSLHNLWEGREVNEKKIPFFFCCWCVSVSFHHNFLSISFHSTMVTRLWNLPHIEFSIFLNNFFPLFFRAFLSLSLHSSRRKISLSGIVFDDLSMSHDYVVLILHVSSFTRTRQLFFSLLFIENSVLRKSRKKKRVETHNRRCVSTTSTLTLLDSNVVTK